MKYKSFVIIDETGDSLEITQSLIDSGAKIVGAYAESTGLLNKVLESQADFVVLILNHFNVLIQDELVKLMAFKSMPVAIFNSFYSEEALQQSVKLGVGAYAVDVQGDRRVVSVLEMAALRFQQLESLRSRVKTAEDKLQGRKVIDRAKGMLMDMHKLSESQAYRTLQKAAMDRGLALHEVALYTVSVIEKQMAGANKVQIEQANQACAPN